MVGNTATITPYVDYSRVYYLNSGRVLTGTMSVNPTLSPEGTLSAATASTTESTLSTLTTFLSSIAGTIFPAAGAAAAKGPKPEAPPSYIVAVKLYMHTHTKNLAGFDPATCIVKGKLTDGAVAVTDVTPVPPAPKEKSDSDKQHADDSKPDSSRPPPSH